MGLFATPRAAAWARPFVGPNQAALEQMLQGMTAARK